MNHDPRSELVSLLDSLFRSVPEMRAGQILAAVGELCSDLHGRGLWEATDAELLEAVWRFEQQFESAMAAKHTDAE